MIGDLEKYLQKMGFWQAFDAAQGAAVMKEEYTRLLREQQQKKLVISSNCPVVVRLIETKYPHLTEYLAPVYSMKQMHAGYSREQYPDGICYRIHQPVYFCNVRTVKSASHARIT